jgi:SPASM domain peptide maturase of grasp-with-spasm system
MPNNLLDSKVLNVFSDCIITKGFKRAIISDLTRRKYNFIPLNLAELLIECIGYTKKRIIKEYGPENENTILEYFDFLENNEFVFWCELEEIKHFPKINLEYRSPSIISNMIIDYNENSPTSISNILTQIESLNCQYIQIRCFSYKSLKFWTEELKSVNDSRIKGIELITKWDSEINIEQLENFYENNPRVHSIILYSSPKVEIIQKEGSIGNVVYILEEISNNANCGQIHWNYFNTNIKLFTEAQQHNTCLNRKISIDVNGAIKNCPSMAKSYGNIKDTTLAEAIEKPGFKDLWFINKDQIDVCKDCEFRYICTDCRAYLENPEDIYSKPLKCGYNPYTAEWEEWSTNPLKQKAIEYYGMQELVKKEK